MENRYVTNLFEPGLNFKTTRRGNVLKIDTAEVSRKKGNHLDDFIDVLGANTQGESVNIRELLEQYALALHNRHAGFGPDIAQTQDRGSVRDNRNKV